jgi:hypothetical protein
VRQSETKWFALSKSLCNATQGFVGDAVSLCLMGPPPHGVGVVLVGVQSCTAPSKRPRPQLPVGGAAPRRLPLNHDASLL